MSFDGYMRTIQQKTGKAPEELVALAEQKGLTRDGMKAGAIIDWLKHDYGLGRGHAMAIVALIKRHDGPTGSTTDRIALHFAGRRAEWQPAYAELVSATARFGGGVDVDPGKSYLSLRRDRKKFAIVKVTVERLDVGLKLKGVTPTDRLEAAGSWNSMVTHRVRLHSQQEIDEELTGWLRQAYQSA